MVGSVCKSEKLLLFGLIGAVLICTTLGSPLPQEDESYYDIDPTTASILDEDEEPTTPRYISTSSEQTISSSSTTTELSTDNISTTTQLTTNSSNATTELTSNSINTTTELTISNRISTPESTISSSNTTTELTTNSSTTTELTFNSSSTTTELTISTEVPESTSSNITTEPTSNSSSTTSEQTISTTTTSTTTTSTTTTSTTTTSTTTTEYPYNAIAQVYSLPVNLTFTMQFAGGKHHYEVGPNEDPNKRALEEYKYNFERVELGLPPTIKPHYGRPNY